MVSMMSTSATEPDLSSTGVRTFEPFPVHFFAPTNVPVSEWNAYSLAYGEEIVITPTIWALSQDRNGDSWLDLLDDPEAQIARFGRVRFARGPWPTDLPKIEPGSPEEEIRKAREWSELWNLPTSEARAARRAELTEKYGSPPAMNTNIAFVPGKEES
jgi:hypothetical protein